MEILPRYLSYLISAQATSRRCRGATESLKGMSSAISFEVAWLPRVAVDTAETIREKAWLSDQLPEAVSCIALSIRTSAVDIVEDLQTGV